MNRITCIPNARAFTLVNEVGTLLADTNNVNANIESNQAKMKNATLITWDWKAQMNIDELNTALARCEDPYVYPVETGSDDYAVIVAESGSSLKKAQAKFDSRHR